MEIGFNLLHDNLRYQSLGLRSKDMDISNKSTKYFFSLDMNKEHKETVCKVSVKKIPIF